MTQLRALVIDDSKVMRNMVMQHIRSAKLGWFVFTEASDGAEALAMFDPNQFDICFVDWNMPNMCGIDFVKAVRARGDSSHVAMVMVTSEQTLGKIEEALNEAGADAYICKPFKVESFQVKLENIVNMIVASKEPKPQQGGFFSKMFS